MKLHLIFLGLLLSIALKSQSLKVSLNPEVKNEFEVWDVIEIPIDMTNQSNVNVPYIIDGMIYLPNGTDVRRLHPSGNVPYSDGTTNFDPFINWNPENYTIKPGAKFSQTTLKAAKNCTYVNRWPIYNVFPYNNGYRSSSSINFPLPTGDYVYHAVIQTINKERYIIDHPFKIVNSSDSIIERYIKFEEISDVYFRSLDYNKLNNCFNNLNKPLFQSLDTSKISPKILSYFEGLSCDYIYDLNKISTYFEKIEDRTALLVLLKKITILLSPENLKWKNYVDLDKFNYYNNTLTKLKKQKDKSIAESFYGYIYEQETYFPVVNTFTTSEQSKWILSTKQLRSLERTLY